MHTTYQPTGWAKGHQAALISMQAVLYQTKILGILGVGLHFHRVGHLYDLALALLETFMVVYLKQPLPTE